jgi:hypothetical protein
MAKKDITVVCPCCETEIVVDVLTQKVLRHRAKGATAESTWGEAHARVAGREGRGTDAFDAALSGEKSRVRDLDDLFDAAKKKVEERKKREL